MTRLSLSDITGEQRVKLSLDLPARLHSSLVDYGIALNGGVQQGAPEPSALVVPMLERFIASDRDFARAQRRSASRRPR